MRKRSPYKHDFAAEKLIFSKDYMVMARQWSEIMATKHLWAARRLNHSLDPYIFEVTINRNVHNRADEFSVLIDHIAESDAMQVRKDWLYFCEGY